MTRNSQTAYRLEVFSTRHESCNIAITEEYKSRHDHASEEHKKVRIEKWTDNLCQRLLHMRFDFVLLFDAE
jgi:hypothetical protein